MPWRGAGLHTARQVSVPQGLQCTGVLIAARRTQHMVSPQLVRLEDSFPRTISSNECSVGDTLGKGGSPYLFNLSRVLRTPVLPPFLIFSTCNSALEILSF